MHLAYIPLSMETKYQKGKKNILQWPWHLILMQKKKGMTAFEAKSMKFLYISYDLISLSPTNSRSLYKDSCIWANSAPAILWWHSGKFLTAVLFAAFLVYFIPSPQRHAFSDGKKIIVFIIYEWNWKSIWWTNELE